MSALESRLKDALTAKAATTTLSPDARDRIEQRVGRSAKPRASRRSFALAAAMLAVVGTLAAVSTVGELRDDPAPTALPRISPQPPNRDAPMVGLRMKGACDSLLCDAGVVAAANYLMPDRPESVLLQGRFQDVSIVGGEYWALADRPSQVIRLADGKPQLVEDFKNDRVRSAPIELSDGRLVVTTSVVLADGTTTFDLVIHDRSTGARQPLLRDENRLSNPVIGPGGQIGVIQSIGDDASVFRTFTAAGTDLAVVRLPERRNGYSEVRVSWSRLGLLAISGNLVGWDHDASTSIVDPVSGREVHHIDEWMGQAWSPDGTALLLARPAAKGRRTELATATGSALRNSSSITASARRSTTTSCRCFGSHRNDDPYRLRVRAGRSTSALTLLARRSTAFSSSSIRAWSVRICSPTISAPPSTVRITSAIPAEARYGI
ncbi:MAG TPA: hypothetical protein VNB24_09290 [Acidimicrobiales bacterium]|nr:hypothetical protein [Acidimicrobiales bacterium]